MGYQIYDNALPAKDFENIKKIITGPTFPWYYSSRNAPYENGGRLGKYDFCFRHLFYEDHAPASQFFTVLDPIIRVLNPSAFVRISAHLTTLEPTIRKIGEHHGNQLDRSFVFQGETAIYFLSTNDSYLAFDEREHIESVGNRLLIFSALENYTITSCTNSKFRCDIKFDYYNQYSRND